MTDNRAIEYRHDDYNFVLQLVKEKPTKPPLEKISEYIEGKRVLPPNTPFPGFWGNDKTPYLVEPMDNMSPASPVQHGIHMKGAQLGMTAAAENVLAYWMDENPTEILFISASQPLLEKWGTKRLEPLIDSCGFRHKIFAQIKHQQSRRSGDKVYIKEYMGGTLDMASAQSPGSLRQDAKRLLLRDEIDGAPALLKSGEGNWLEVSYARTNAWGARRKIFDFSTPTTIERSEIYKLYLEGDQRKFFVPCPHCGKYQPLVWSGEHSNHGIRADMKDGFIDRVYYLCEFCHEAIFNHHKALMLPAGRWEPISRSSSRYMRSYQISSLYSPIGMLTWEDIYLKYLKAQEDPDGMRSFVNLYLGEPYKEVGSRPKLEKVIELRGGYKSGEIPDGVLFLTFGIDVQRGSKKDENNPPRLEMEVCGHGIGFRSWSIIYQVFIGDVDDPFSGAWEDLNNWVIEGGFIFTRSDGREFSPVLGLIDSGDGNITDVVYRFCSRWNSTYPSKGFSALKRHRTEKGDEAGPSNFLRYRHRRIGEDLLLVEVSTNYYKTHCYNNLRIERQDTPPQKPGFCDFPIDYPEKYFRMLTAEEKRRDGSFHAGQRRNESLDCRVMNLCGCDIYLDTEVQFWKTKHLSSGYTKEQVQNISRRDVLEFLIQTTQRKPIEVS